MPLEQPLPKRRSLIPAGPSHRARSSGIRTSGVPLAGPPTSRVWRTGSPTGSTPTAMRGSRWTSGIRRPSGKCCASPGRRSIAGRAARVCTWNWGQKVRSSFPSRTPRPNSGSDKAITRTWRRQPSASCPKLLRPAVWREQPPSCRSMAGRPCRWTGWRWSSAICDGPRMAGSRQRVMLLRARMNGRLHPVTFHPNLLHHPRLSSQLRRRQTIVRPSLRRPRCGHQPQSRRQ